MRFKVLSILNTITIVIVVAFFYLPWYYLPCKKLEVTEGGDNLPFKKPVLSAGRDNSPTKMPVVPNIRLSNCSVKPLSQSNSSSCQLNAKNLTIYMDSFDWLSKKWMIDLYTNYIIASKRCPPLPGGGVCTYTVDDKCADGILFYCAHSDLNYTKQHPQQIVISFSLEPENGPDIYFPPDLHEDIKVSYLRTSNVPVPFICDRALHLYNMGQPEIPTGKRGIVGFVSNCRIKWRNKYITELMDHIAVDQLGRCYRKRPSRFSKTRSFGNWEDTKLQFLKKSHYKYMIAFENSMETDYVSEKVFNGLLTGTIPIYYGNRSVYDHIPGKHTIIYAPDYTPKELADYINQIDNDEELYASFFKDWNLKKMLALHKHYCHDHFMCRICRKALEVRYHQEGCTNMKLMEKGDH